MTLTARARGWIFTGIVAGSTLFAAGYAYRVAEQASQLTRQTSLPALRPERASDGTATRAATSGAAPGSAEPTGPGAPPSSNASPPATGGPDTPADEPDGGPPSTVPRVRLAFRHTELDRSFGAVAVDEVPARGAGDRRATTLRCDRIHARRDRGICLTVDRSYATNSLFVFDDAFRIVHTLPLTGVPSRARVSPDGRYAALTVFVFGHSYGDGDFSTETSIIDTHTGARIIPTLQDLDVTQGGARFSAIDFNFWGVTFTRDSDRYFATLRSGGRTYLVEGRVSTRQLRVLRENVECPSVSPDDRRLVFKKRVSDDPAALWRLHVLDLETMTDRPLADTRSIDDQAEWLDGNRVIYGAPRPGAPAGVTDLWETPADGTGVPRIVLRGAASPSVRP